MKIKSTKDLPKISFFKCLECLYKWHDVDVKKGDTRTCSNGCGTRVLPYTNRIKAFGNFQCKKCKRSWSSSHTYAKTFQKCKVCVNEEVFPHKMFPLRFKGIKSGNSPHMEGLCGRCLKLGRRCFDNEDLDLVTEKLKKLKI